MPAADFSASDANGHTVKLATFDVRSGGGGSAKPSMRRFSRFSRKNDTLVSQRRRKRKGKTLIRILTRVAHMSHTLLSPRALSHKIGFLKKPHLRGIFDRNLTDKVFSENLLDVFSENLFEVFSESLLYGTAEDRPLE